MPISIYGKSFVPIKIKGKYIYPLLIPISVLPKDILRELREKKNAY